VQEVKAEQAERAAAQAATQSTTQQVPATPQPQQQQPVAPQQLPPAMDETTGSTQVAQTPATPSSIYPEPTKGLGVAAPEPTPSAPVSTPTIDTSSRARKVLAVRVFASLTIAVELYPMYYLISNAIQGQVNVVYAIEILTVLALAIGVFMLKELARFAYVLVAVILLVVPTVDLVKLYRNHPKTTSSSNTAGSQLPSNSQIIAMDEATLRKPDPSLTPQERQISDQGIESQIKRLETPAVVQDTEKYISDYSLVVTALLPLVFLTLRPVKEVFN